MGLVQVKGTKATYRCDRLQCDGTFRAIDATFLPKFCPWCGHGGNLEAGK